MNVNIVCVRLHADRVLPRLARTLAAGTGWTLSEEPDPKADINYFFPYLELQRSEWRETLSAAWFTHKDMANKHKAAIWEDVARRVDLRLTSTPMYLPELRQFGPAEYARVAIERGHFTLGPKRARGRVVGVSGYSYRDNRKGEDLIARLAISPIGKSCQWKASGREWPVPTKGHAWADMPGFYQSLDLFVCASRMEGPGMPPLEALSCGIPVIVPRGVGIFDELPDISGIYRFEAGNYRSLLAAFTEAMEDDEPINRKRLREATAPYTVDNWCADHVAALERMMFGEFEVGELPDWRGRAGMYLVAFGEPSRRCAIRCIRSFKRHNPGIPVALIAAEPLGAGEDVFIKYEDKDIGGRQAKLAIDVQAPREWTYILYLDADQEIMEPLGFIFDTLQAGWELVICKDMHDRFSLRTMMRGDNRAEYDITVNLVGTDQVHQYNGGMFAYRRSNRTAHFFRLWNEEYQTWLMRDQGALIRALYNYPLRLYVLGNQWNASDRYELPPGPLAMIHHNIQARRYGKPPGIGRLDSKAAWEEVKRWEAAQRGDP